MATHPAHIGRASALPLSTALSIIPSLPRPLLARLVERALERLDEIDGDADLELTWPEWRANGTHAALPYATDDDEDGCDSEQDEE